MKLWEKGVSNPQDIEKFTVGQDRELDLQLAEYDVLGSLAHAAMLKSIDLLTETEWQSIRSALLVLLGKIKQGEFLIEEGIEDVHSQVEHLLTQELGDAGKKIHSGRSRNDQVLVDIKLFLRDQIKLLTTQISELGKVLLDLSQNHQEILIPGYTHMQAAMPSSFGLWFGAYAESFVDDLQIMQAAYKVINQNPLGSAAGYGNSFPLDRKLTSKLLGFKEPHINVVAAQMSRGKSETAMAFAIASAAGTLGKMAMDICLYNSQNYGFLSFPEHITTGSSIMPHKKNPDVFELIRARCNLLQQLPAQITSVTTNLPSGYHRDLQLTKEVLLPSIDQLKDCLDIAHSTLPQVQVNKEAINDPKYDLIFSVENVNQQVLQGIPFRDAYRQVALEIGEGTFKPLRSVKHSHLGSIGNPGTELIREKFAKVVEGFEFAKAEQALEALTRG